MYKMTLLICLLVSTTLTAAEVYRSVDQYGNVIFSDVPSENSEKIEVRELPTVPPPAQQPAYTPRQEPIERYTSLSITRPVNDGTYFRAEGDLIVSVSTQPRLAVGDTVVIYLNSNEYLSGKSLSFSIPELDRGTYQLRAAIKDASGKIVKSSETITFHMRQASALSPQRAPNPGN